MKTSRRKTRNTGRRSTRRTRKTKRRRSLVKVKNTPRTRIEKEEATRLSIISQLAQTRMIQLPISVLRFIKHLRYELFANSV